MTALTQHVRTIRWLVCWIAGVSCVIGGILVPLLVVAERVASITWWPLHHGLIDVAQGIVRYALAIAAGLFAGGVGLMVAGPAAFGFITLSSTKSGQSGQTVAEQGQT